MNDPFACQLNNLSCQVSAVITSVGESRFITPTAQDSWTYILYGGYTYLDFLVILGEKEFAETSLSIQSLYGFHQSNSLDAYFDQYIWWASKDSLIWDAMYEKISHSICCTITSSCNQLYLSLLTPVGKSSRVNSLNSLIPSSQKVYESHKVDSLDVEVLFRSVKPCHHARRKRKILFFASTATDIDYYGLHYYRQGYEIIFISLESLPAWLTQTSMEYGQLVYFRDSLIYSTYEYNQPMNLSYIKDITNYNKDYCKKFLDYLYSLQMAEQLFSRISGISKILVVDHPILCMHPFINYAEKNNIDVVIIPHNKTNYGFAWARENPESNIELFCPLESEYKYNDDLLIHPTNKFLYQAKSKSRNISKFAVIFLPAVIAPRNNTYYSPLSLMKRIALALVKYMDKCGCDHPIYCKPKNYYPLDLNFKSMLKLCKDHLSFEEYKILDIVIPMDKRISSGKLMEFDINAIFIRDGSMIEDCLINGNPVYHLMDNECTWQLVENIGINNIFRSHSNYHIL